MDNLKSVKYLQNHTYHPYNPTFKNNDEIRIPVNSQDVYTVPGDSHVYIEGSLTVQKKPSVATQQVDLTLETVNNAAAFLFDQVRYEINGVEVDKTRMVGLTSTVKTLLTSTKEEAKALKIAGWDSPHSNGTTFYALIPLSMLLGFAADFKGVLIRVRQELILVRSRTNKNAYKITTDVDKKDVTLTVSKVQWIMPQVKFNLGPEKVLLDKVKNNASFQIPFRSFETHMYPQLPNNNKETWKLMTTSNVEAPSYIIIIFQTDRMDTNETDASKFDHVHLRSIKVHLNSVSLPYETLNEDFEKGRYLYFYQNYLNFITDFSNGEKLCEPLLSLADFKSDNPMFILKCLYEDIIKPGSLDIQIELEAAKNFPSNTAAYAILIHDVMFSYQSLTGLVKKLH